MTRFDVVGLGASVLDIVQLVEHFPAQEEVQRAEDGLVQGGGPVATAMVALARLGARVAMLDVLGDDWRGALIREEFQKEGVCIDHIRQVGGCTSALASILVTKGDGARTIVFSPGTAPELSSVDLPRAVIESARFLHLNGRHWEACLQACAWARKADVQVSYDGGAHRYRPEMKQLVPLTDVCIVARDFAVKYTGVTGVQDAAEALLEEGPQIVVVTDGRNGSWVHSRDTPALHQPAYLLPEVVDTTGCGDSYHGAFLFGLLRGMDLEETASFASAVAALNSQRLGGRAGLPNLGQVSAFLNKISG
jgi:sugar/nucleoside kinase (ribokinase family)